MQKDPNYSISGRPVCRKLLFKTMQNNGCEKKGKNFQHQKLTTFVIQELSFPFFTAIGFIIHRFGLQATQI